MSCHISSLSLYHHHYFHPHVHHKIYIWYDISFPIIIIIIPTIIYPPFCPQALSGSSRFQSPLIHFLFRTCNSLLFFLLCFSLLLLHIYLLYLCISLLLFLLCFYLHLLHISLLFLCISLLFAWHFFIFSNCIDWYIYSDRVRWPFKLVC